MIALIAYLRGANVPPGVIGAELAIEGFAVVLFIRFVIF